MSEDDRMVRDNINLIYKVMKDHNLLYMEDELFDVGLIGLTKGIKSYDKKKNSCESTYMYACIKREIFGCLRKMHALKRTLFKEVSLNTKVKISWENDDEVELINCIADTNSDFEKKAEIEERNEMLEKYVCRLNPSQRELICLYFGVLGYNRMTLSELKEKYGLSKQTICVRKNQILEKLRAMYENDMNAGRSN